MKKPNWKDSAELIGIAAILVTHIIQVVELRQTKNIATSEAYRGNFNNTATTQALISEYAHVWVKGNTEAELSPDEDQIFKSLITVVGTSFFIDWYALNEIGDIAGADTTLNDFVGFLYQNPGARREWLERENTLWKHRRILNPQESFVPGYLERIQSELENLIN